MAGSKKLRHELVEKVVGWARNSMLSAEKIAAHFGVPKSLVQDIIDEERK